MQPPGPPIMPYATTLAAAKTFSKSIGIISFVIGIPGNIISIMVLLRPSLRETSVSIYFVFLAICDSLALLASFPISVLGYSINEYTNHYTQWTCKINLYLLHASALCSYWLVMFCTFDRLIAVCYPFRAKQWLSPKKTTIYCTLLCGIVYAAFSYQLVTRGNQNIERGGRNITVNCGYTSPAHEYHTKRFEGWPYVSVFFFLPIVIIIITNVVIMRGIRKHEAFKKHSTQPQASTQRSNKQMRSLTIMLMVCCIALVVLTTPNCITHALLPEILDLTNFKELILYAICRIITTSINNLNHAVNVFLYILSGTRFREELIQMFSCKTKLALPIRRNYKHNESFKSSTKSKDGSHHDQSASTAETNSSANPESAKETNPLSGMHEQTKDDEK